MKQKLLLYFCLIFASIHSQAQVPLSIPYQAIARDNSGNAIINQTISLRFSIHNGNSGAALVYQETQTVITNQFGLFTAEIGTGSVVVGTFGNDIFAEGPPFRYIIVEMDIAGGSNYVFMGATYPTSVPYAMYAGNGGNWNRIGNDIYNTNTGKIGIGTTTPGTVANTTARLEIADEGGLNSDLQLRTASGLPFLSFASSKGTLSTPLAKDSGEWVGVINSYSYNGNSYEETGKIVMQAEGGTAAGSIRFFTTDFNNSISSEKMVIDDKGFLGIGTQKPSHMLDVRGNAWIGTQQSSSGFTPLDDVLYFGSSRKYLSNTLGAPVDGATDWMNLMAHPLSAGIILGTSGPSDTDPHSAPTPLMVVRSTGNVGIGTSAPQSKLAVNGKITCKEVEVTLSGFPDYVFQKDYKRMSLREIDDYIKANGRLPKMPSEKDVTENGLDLGKINVLLVEKVEELTLQMIDNENRMEEMKKEIDQLRAVLIEQIKK